MKVSILFLTLSLAYGCSNVSGQTEMAYNPPINAFAVHAETMGANATKRPQARNVVIGNNGVMACFDTCTTQVFLNFCGQVVIEIPGKDPDVYAARVFQLDPGVWTAEIDGGQYVNLYAESGTVKMDIAGEFRAFTPTK